jgi:hypothetical protein
MNSISGVALGSMALGRDASEAAGLGMGQVKVEKGGGEEEAGRAGLSFQLGFSPLPNRN